VPATVVARTWHAVDASDEASQLVTVLVTALVSGRGRAARVAMVVPQWYRSSVAMNLRLTDEETEALRRRAEQEGRSMQDVARAAIRQYTAGRQERLAAAIERIRTEDAELLDRLSK
jgi:predicted transcriptional regulator